MDLLACVSVPYVALQSVIRRHPEYTEISTAIVDELKPMGRILEVNRAARKQRILPGMRYAAGLSLDRNLRAEVVSPQEIATHVAELQTILSYFSPRIEASHDEAGTFWVCVKGLDRLFGSWDRWAESLHQEITNYGLISAVVVGYSRFHTYAMARVLRGGVHLFATPEDEVRLAESLPLERIGLEPDVLTSLRSLGVIRVGQFVRLPPTGVQERYGPLATRIHRLARGELRLPLDPIKHEEALERVIHFEDDEVENTRLLFTIKQELRPLLVKLAQRHEDLHTLFVRLRLRDGDSHEHAVRPALPTLDELRILELVRLKLENLVIPSGVVMMSLVAQGKVFEREQLRLFAGARRDLEAAAHALARVRAEFGDQSVLEFVPGNSHIPERRYTLNPTSRLRLAVHVDLPAAPSLVRRIQVDPKPLLRFKHEPLEGWMIRGLDEGPIVDARGPFAISSHWWSTDDEVSREYWIATTSRGDVYWVYWDALREQWFLHGEAE